MTKLSPRLPAILMLVTFILWAASLPALAHAVLISTNPESGAVLEKSPAGVDLTFSEPVAPLGATLVQPDGTSIRLTDMTSAGAVLSIALPPQYRADGTRVLSYRVVSDDGHPVAGAIVFSVGQVSGTAEAPQQSDPLAASLLWLARAITFVALFVGVGGMGFRAIAPIPPTARLVIAVSVSVGLLSALATIGLHGLDTLGRGLPSLAEPGVWSVGFSSPYGTTSMLEGLAFLAALVSLMGRRRFAVALSSLAIVVAGLAIALSGHAAAADPQWLTRVAVFLHIACIAWWVGGLFPLAIVLKQGRRASARPLIRFSRLIPFAVGPLVVSGIVLAVVQLGWPGPAWLTPYGLILASKLLLLAVLFAIASWNRWVLTAPAARGDLISRTHMQGTIVVELFLIAAVLALVSGWRFTPPPRALEVSQAVEQASSEQAGPQLRLEGDGVVAGLAFTSDRVGANTAYIQLTDGTAPLTAKGIVVALSQPALGMEPFKTIATLSPDGRWMAAPLQIPIAGTWEIELQVRVSDFKLVRLMGHVALGQ